MKSPSVLIVEDDGIIALQLLEILEKAGYDAPDPVASGEEAIESVKTSPPAIVLMDIRLAGRIDGIEAARQIRDLSDIPVIFLTAHHDMKQLPRIREIKPSGYIVKPFIDEEVLAAIRKELGTNR